MEQIASRKWAFTKGFGQVPNESVKEVRAELMQVLCLNNMQSWYNRLYGKKEPRISEAEKITAVFAKFDIHDIWG
jgi:hypothetical protein